MQQLLLGVSTASSCMQPPKQLASTGAAHVHNVTNVTESYCDSSLLLLMRRRCPARSRP